MTNKQKKIEKIDYIIKTLNILGWLETSEDVKIEMLADKLIEILDKLNEVIERINSNE